jgi:hypothetical protein
MLNPASTWDEAYVLALPSADSDDDNDVESAA